MTKTIELCTDEEIATALMLAEGGATFHRVQDGAGKAVQS
jgi:hypothetical protein